MNLWTFLDKHIEDTISGIILIVFLGGMYWAAIRIFTFHDKEDDDE